MLKKIVVQGQVMQATSQHIPSPHDHALPQEIQLKLIEHLQVRPYRTYRAPQPCSKQPPRKPCKISRLLPRLSVLPPLYPSMQVP